MRVRDPQLLRILHLSPDKECVLCGTTFDLELHHVYPRGQGGGDVRENLVFLCNDQHTLVTRNDRATCHDLGHYLEEERPDIIDYVLSLHPANEQGWAWLERRYGVAA